MKAKTVKAETKQMIDIKVLGVNAKKGFKFLVGINREIIPAHVSALASSILQLGILRPIVVATISFLDGVPTKYIIDGQHTFTALLRLKKDIPYVEIEISSLEQLIETIAKLNTTSKTWHLVDYINTWAYYKPEYKEFKRLFNLYNIERGILAELLHTGIVTGRTQGIKESISSIIKKGKLRIINKELALQILDYVVDLREITSDLGRAEQKLIISVIIEKIKADGAGYNHEQYKKYLISIKKELILASNDMETVRVLLSH